MPNTPLKEKNIKLSMADKGIKSIKVAKTAGTAVIMAKNFAQKGISAMQQGDTPEEGAAHFAKAETTEIAKDGKDTVVKTVRKAKNKVKSKAKNQLKEHIKDRIKTKTNKTASNTSRQSIKTAGKTGVKASSWAAKSSVKMTAWNTKVTAKMTAWSTKTSAKIAAKAAEAAAKTTVKATEETIKAAQIAAQAVVRVSAATVKVAATVISAVGKALSAIAAVGGLGILFIIILIVLFVLMFCYSEWGFITMQNEAKEPLTEVIAEMYDPAEEAYKWFNGKIYAHTVGNTPPDIIFEDFSVDDNGEAFEIDNWSDIIAVLFSEIMSGELGNEGTNVMTSQRQSRLRELLWDMYSLDFDIDEVVEVRAELTEEEIAAGKTEGKLLKKKLYVSVNKKSLTAEQAADMYGFTEIQRSYLAELTSESGREMISYVIGQNPDGYGTPIAANPNMPVSLVGESIVHNAKRYLGRSYASMDCSALVRAAYRDTGFDWTGTSTVMAKNCVDMNVVVDESQIMPGDLVFWSSIDPNRGSAYCSNSRCKGGTCKRWNRIHHVAIYIGDGKVIESVTGGVSINDLWESRKWKIAFYARPYVTVE